MSLLCQNLSVRYGQRQALTDLSVSIIPGEIVCLIGPNGSGKSTALRSLAGLTRPHAGRVQLDGRPMDQWRRRELAKRLSFLPQAPIAPDELSVEDLARQGRYSHVGLFRNHSPEDAHAVAWALDATGTSSFAQRGLRELSGGERQRAWIAAALAQEAGILLLDEPTSFLDIGHQVEVLELICTLSRERGVTVILAIHDINQAMMVGDRILLLEGGRLRFDGRAQDLAGSGLIESAFNVRGAFVKLGDGTVPHFDIDLRRTPTGQ
ncbi:ABC transporter ATP-binding protein [Oryzicola mucosus]|uniref:ABC transporter ATP-binding protein n=1 Tax=Oryzicola mucosus TaxID=2767425 RepID=A0A8J6TX35_9HYPH|nr:ABC transporter ATP-binding protein [Oryzicola mucosus]MBD0413184.1 ABC transporter ATP-binding protein [Oryzicola mucosus]